jgi:hypothetical protein
MPCKVQVSFFSSQGVRDGIAARSGMNISRQSATDCAGIRSQPSVASRSAASVFRIFAIGDRAGRRRLLKQPDRAV